MTRSYMQENKLGRHTLDQGTTFSSYKLCGAAVIDIIISSNNTWFYWISDSHIDNSSSWAVMEMHVQDHFLIHRFQSHLLWLIHSLKYKVTIIDIIIPFTFSMQHTFQPRHSFRKMIHQDAVQTNGILHTKSTLSTFHSTRLHTHSFTHTRSDIHSHTHYAIYIFTWPQMSDILSRYSAAFPNLCHEKLQQYMLFA